MIITLLGGQKVAAVIYTSTGTTMRVAIEGAEDLVDFSYISGQWVSENCQPVEVEFAWQNVAQSEIVTEAECICPAEVASALVDLLWKGGADEGVEPLAVGSTGL
ncbi:MAG TPA: hypothetical protein VGH38_09030 [Bryobacteraceae bacterium]|jgi:hypothetical protein